MWFSFIILFIAIAGFIVLFSFKAFELSGKKTPLAHLRKYCDIFIASGFIAFEKGARARCSSFCRKGYLLCREQALYFGSSALTFVHTLTLRLGEHLRKRKALSTRDANDKEGVSFYLKNVLEYKRNTELTRNGVEQAQIEKKDNERRDMADKK